MRPTESHYDTLEVSSRESAETIKAAYKSLMQRHHPDKNPGDRSATTRSTAINVAYEILSNPLKRAAYDADHRAQGGETRCERAKQLHRKLRHLHTVVRLPLHHLHRLRPRHLPPRAHRRRGLLLRALLQPQVVPAIRTVFTGHNPAVAHQPAHSPFTAKASFAPFLKPL